MKEWGTFDKKHRTGVRSGTGRGGVRGLPARRNWSEGILSGLLGGKNRGKKGRDNQQHNDYKRRINLETNPKAVCIPKIVKLSNRSRQGEQEKEEGINKERKRTTEVLVQFPRDCLIKNHPCIENNHQ